MISMILGARLRFFILLSLFIPVVSWILQTKWSRTYSVGKLGAERSQSTLLVEQGKINRFLAERIWNWEQESRVKAQLPKLEYSVRQGLRLVEGSVKRALHNHRNDGWSATELEQEGLTALLDAMRMFRELQTSNPDATKDFEGFCKGEIQRHLKACLGESQRPVKIPTHVLQIVKQAKLLRQAIQREYGKVPTWGRVAQDLGLPTEVLQTYIRLASGDTVSMESTVEVHTANDVKYADQDDWELQNGWLLDTGNSLDQSQVVENFLDEQLEYEGDDQAWVLQHDESGPLADSIVDLESEDESALMLMIQSNVTSFLESVLDPVEVEAVRLYFGLDPGSTGNEESPSSDSTQGDLVDASFRYTAEQMDMPEEQARILLQSSMRKLRDSYTSRYISDISMDEMDSL